MSDGLDFLGLQIAILELTALGDDDAHPVADSDFAQGAIGDCYLLTAMLALLYEDPDLVDGETVVVASQVRDAEVLVVGWGSTFGPIGAACRRVRKAGLDVVMDTCPKIEWRRLRGMGAHR